MGLSTSHIVTESNDTLIVYEDNRAVKRRKRAAQLTLFDGGSRIEAKRARWKIPQRGGGMRQAIKTFSYNSRRRLQRTLAELKRDKLPVFITLTYPEAYPEDSAVYKEHLRRFGIYLRRRYLRAAFIWRLEFQKRGAPHYHLLVWGVPYNGKQWQALKPYVSKLWYDIVDSGDEKHLRAGTRVEKIKSYRQMVGYVSKIVARVASGEMSKTEQATMSYVGRWWGVVGRDNLPWATKFVLEITDKKASEFIRMMRRYARLKVTRAYKTLSIFTDVDAWTKHLPQLLYPEDIPSHESGKLRSHIFAMERA